MLAASLFGGGSGGLFRRPAHGRGILVGRRVPAVPQDLPFWHVACICRSGGSCEHGDSWISPRRSIRHAGDGAPYPWARQLGRAPRPRGAARSSVLARSLYLSAGPILRTRRLGTPRSVPFGTPGTARPTHGRGILVGRRVPAVPQDLPFWHVACICRSGRSCEHGDSWISPRRSIRHAGDGAPYPWARQLGRAPRPRGAARSSVLARGLYLSIWQILRTRRLMDLPAAFYSARRGRRALPMGVASW